MILITDTHFGVRNDSPAFHAHYRESLENVFYPLMVQYPDAGIVHLGDLTHRRKYVNYLTKLEMDGFIRELHRCSRPAGTKFIVGNHDVYYRNTNDVNCFDSLYGHQIQSISEPVERGNILFLPWINDENRQDTIDLIKSSDAGIVMGHLELNGFQMSPGTSCSEGLEPDLFHRFDLVMSGHFHTRSGKGNVRYLGSPWDQTSSDAGEIKGFHVFDDETLELTFVPNPYKMFHTIHWHEGIECDPERYKGTIVKIVLKEEPDYTKFNKFTVALSAVGLDSLKIVEDFHSAPDWEGEGVCGSTQANIETSVDYFDDLLPTSEAKHEMKVLMKELHDNAESRK